MEIENTDMSGESKTPQMSIRWALGGQGLAACGVPPDMALPGLAWNGAPAEDRLAVFDPSHNPTSFSVRLPVTPNLSLPLLTTPAQTKAVTGLGFISHFLYLLHSPEKFQFLDRGWV